VGAELIAKIGDLRLEQGDLDAELVEFEEAVGILQSEENYDTARQIIDGL
jgi:hypothetical protein